MTSDEFDVTGFNLVEGATSPITGIKINIDGINSYQSQSTFKFTDKTASKDATLSDLKVSSGVVDETNPDNSTYKEYDLTPTFAQDILKYELTLLEYIDIVDITATKTDLNATMKIKVPKRDENNELIYDTDGTTIIYEEKDIESGIPLEVTINKLGEPDTNITVIVTAEDGKTINNYELVIKRPYGIIKGSVETETSVDVEIHKATIRIYRSDLVTSIIDWSTIIEGTQDSLHNELLTLDSIEVETNDDGTYKVYVVPGTYDILLDRIGYLDHIITSITVAEEEIDIGFRKLIAGDTNKDGVIQLVDLSDLVSLYGINDTNEKYDIRFDFNNDKQIQLQDMSKIIENYSKARIVEK